MNRYKLTRLAAAGAAAALTLTLAGCNGSASSATPSPSPTVSPTQSQTSGGNLKTGLGITADLSASDMNGKATVTAAGVLLDGNGKILCCVLDVAENSYAASADGSLAMPAAYMTKWEQGDGYGLKAASGIGKEWYEQAGAFCDYVAGKTPDEVGKLKMDEQGKATDPDLLSGCTIKVGAFVDAIKKACEDAKPLGAAEGDLLSLGTVSTPSGTDATDDADGKAQVTSTFVLMTRDGAGYVTSAVMDQIQPTFTVDTNGQLLAKDANVQTKRELGDAYGLKQASGIGKEWYEQSEAFCAYLNGKMASSIRAIPANGTDADLAAVCTIDWNDLLQAAVKAAEADVEDHED